MDWIYTLMHELYFYGKVSQLY